MTTQDFSTARYIHIAIPYDPNCDEYHLITFSDGTSDSQEFMLSAVEINKPETSWSKSAVVGIAHNGIYTEFIEVAPTHRPTTHHSSPSRHPKEAAINQLARITGLSFRPLGRLL